MEFKECRGCPGYCCFHNFSLATPVTSADIDRISKHLNVPVDQFIANFVVLNNGPRKMLYEDAPDAVGHFKNERPYCLFLKEGLCKINSAKPRACRDQTPVHIGGGITCGEYHRVRAGVR
jgi:Fe-S-cluster containining protein